MNDKNIKDVFLKYEIKTSSDDILREYKKSLVKDKKTSIFSYSRLVISLLSVILIIFSLYVFFNKGTINQPHVVIKPEITGGSEGKVAFQVFSGLEIFNSYDSNSNGRRMAKSISLDDFSKMVKVYDKYSNLIEKLEVVNENFVLNTYEGEFETELGKYPYKMELTNGIIFYYDIKFEKDDDEDEHEGEFHGEIHDNNLNVMIVKGEKEINQKTKEMEIELEIEIDDNKILEISEEFESNEYSYSYEIIENGETLLEVELDREYENKEIKVELEVKINNEEYIFEIINNKVSYEAFNIKGNFIITKEGSSIIYKDSTGLEYVI